MVDRRRAATRSSRPEAFYAKVASTTFVFALDTRFLRQESPAGAAVAAT
jgi:hypothetical protein